MTETIWVYDHKKAEKRAKELCELIRNNCTDESVERMENDDREYLASLSEEERESLLETERFREENREIYEKEKKERLEKYDGGIIVSSLSLEIGDRFGGATDKEIFTAVEKNGKIGIFYDDWQTEWLFCDYLRDEKELELFFESIRVKKGYVDTVSVDFVIYDKVINKEIYFNYSQWYPHYEDVEEELVEDNSYNDRDELIKLYLSLSDQKR